jgi:putative FmdB family regulatory protein
MPRYSYVCKECEEFLEVVHSMQETLCDCEKCGKKDVLQRIPSTFLYKKTLAEKEEQKTGTLVKKAINDFKQELKTEKNKLKEERENVE